VSLGLDIDPQFLGLDIVFGLQIKDIDPPSGEFAEDVGEMPTRSRSGRVMIAVAS